MQETTVVLPEIVTDLEKVEKNTKNDKQSTASLSPTFKFCFGGGITLFRSNEVR